MDKVMGIRLYNLKRGCIVNMRVVGSIPCSLVAALFLSAEAMSNPFYIDASRNSLV